MSRKCGERGRKEDFAEKQLRRAQKIILANCRGYVGDVVRKGDVPYGEG